MHKFFILKINMDMRAVSKSNWKEISYPVDLISLPYNFKVVESITSLNFDIEIEDVGKVAYLYFELEDKLSLMRGNAGSVSCVDEVVVSVLSYEPEWNRIIKNILKYFSLDEMQLTWRQNELQPGQWQLHVKNRIYYFPDQHRANVAKEYFKDVGCKIIKSIDI